MDRDQLQAVQGPLKDQYRSDPTSAVVVLRSEGVLGEGITCKVSTGKELADAGLHPATGGNGLELCSGDMLLDALVACAGVTLKAVATSIGVEVRGGSVVATGDFDVRGTLSVDKEAAVGLSDISLAVAVDTSATEEELATLAKLTERFCVVAQTLAETPTFTISRV